MIGTGKTLAYMLPLLTLIDPKKKCVQAIIVVPTRDLAKQVEEIAIPLVTGGSANQKTPILIRTISTHPNSAMVRSIVRNPPHVLIGTPQCVAHVTVAEGYVCGGVTMLVLDEVGSLLEPYSLPLVNAILGPQKPRTLTAT